MGYSAYVTIFMPIYEVFRESQISSINMSSIDELIFQSPTIERLEQETDKFMDRFMPIRDVSVEIGSFGRIYAIDDWILKNVKDVKDNEQQEIYMEYSEVLDFHKIITQVQEDNSKADELIPYDDFFKERGYDYDDNYFLGLKIFKESLDIIIELTDNEVFIDRIQFYRSF